MTGLPSHATASSRRADVPNLPLWYSLVVRSVPQFSLSAFNDIAKVGHSFTSTTRLTAFFRCSSQKISKVSLTNTHKRPKPKARIFPAYVGTTTLNLVKTKRFP
jgi:hypothetical protein